MAKKDMKPADRKRFPPLDGRAAENIRCLICDKILAGRAGYVTHHKQVHGRAAPRWDYTAEAATGAKNNLPKPSQAQTAKRCKLCGMVIGGTTAIQRHFARHHPQTTPRGNYHELAWERWMFTELERALVQIARGNCAAAEKIIDHMLDRAIKQK